MSLNSSFLPGRKYIPCIARNAKVLKEWAQNIEWNMGYYSKP